MTETSVAPPAAAGAAAAPASRRGFLRTNVEAFTVAIVMALVIKQFAFEAFQVPTESMEPTIRGRSPGGDRIIVNKFTYDFRDPARWDVVVFKYPLSRLVNYVKRLVGLPGEQILIAHGDIYVRGDASAEWSIARKPMGAQDAIFESNPVLRAEEVATIRRSTFWDKWQRPQSGAEISDATGTLTLDAGPAERVISTRPEFVIGPERRDRDAPDRRGTADSTVGEPVGDLRFEARVTPKPSAKAVILVITDGTQPTTPLRLELAVAGSDATSRFLHGRVEVGGGGLAARLEPGRESRVVLENVDDRVRVVIDGDEVFRHDYVQSVTTPPNGRSQVSFGLTGGEAVFHRFGLWRDIYTTQFPGCPVEFSVPREHYLFFGDNSANSLDARAFRVVGIRRRSDGRVLLGDLEAVADDLDAPRQDNNPYFELGPDRNIRDREVHHFRDIQGNHWRLEPGSYDILDLTRFDNADGVRILTLHQTTLSSPAAGQVAYSNVDSAELEGLISHTPHAFQANSVLMHYVHRDEIMGRANLVFLPGGKNLLASLIDLGRYRVIR